jgi:hypothetical protein
VAGYKKKGLKKITVKYCKSTETKCCSNKVEVTIEALMVMFVYCTSNADIDTDEVSVDSIAPMEMEECIRSLSEILNILKEESIVFLGAVESEDDISFNSQCDSSIDGRSYANEDNNDGPSVATCHVTDDPCFWNTFMEGALKKPSKRLHIKDSKNERLNVYYSSTWPSVRRACLQQGLK